VEENLFSIQNFDGMSKLVAEHAKGLFEGGRGMVFVGMGQKEISVSPTSRYPLHEDWFLGEGIFQRPKRLKWR
jgi:hypothetical protein